ncbi:DUF3987 domain-containing protein [Herbaspirillum frisingense]|nr:DUF3987 domain-containing protein [Herbaspirillum frisingense]QNB06080.1 DUF3987 domain-containing protein [Herbaspirillum frisingense]
MTIEVEPYPLHAFPDIARQTAFELGEIIQAPNALIGTTMLTTLSACIQGIVDVKLPTGQLRPALLNSSVIANSGERKTATENLLSAPIQERDEANAERHEADMKQYTADLGYWREKGAGIKSQIRQLTLKGESADHLREKLRMHVDEKPTKPRKRRRMMLNATPRAVMDALDGEGSQLPSSVMKVML